MYQFIKKFESGINKTKAKKKKKKMFINKENDMNASNKKYFFPFVFQNFISM